MAGFGGGMFGMMGGKKKKSGLDMFGMGPEGAAGANPPVQRKPPPPGGGYDGSGITAGMGMGGGAEKATPPPMAPQQMPEMSAMMQMPDMMGPSAKLRQSSMGADSMPDMDMLAQLMAALGK